MIISHGNYKFLILLVFLMTSLGLRGKTEWNVLFIAADDLGNVLVC